MTGPAMSFETITELLRPRMATTGRLVCLVNPREAAALRTSGMWLEGLFVETPDLPAVQRTRCPDCQCDPCRCR